MNTAFINARIYTVTRERPWAEAMLVEDGKIAVLGSEQDVRAAASDDTGFVDMQGRMIMPGIHDAHLHLLISGLKFNREARLRPGADAPQIIEDLRTCQCSGPKDDDGNEWIVGGEFFPWALGDEGVDRKFLDAEFPDKPVFLYDYSIHHGLVNSKALELAGITDSVEDPPGGRFVRREGTNELTGEIVEEARWPIMDVMPGYSDEINAEAIAWAIKRCHEFGITSVQEASANSRVLRALRTLDKDGGLKLNVAAHLVWREEGFGGAPGAELERLIETRDAWRSEHVDTGFVKIWLDGAPLPPHMTGAGLTEDNSVEESKILVPREDLRKALVKFDAEGLTVKIHCSREGAVRTALDAIAYVRECNGPDGPPHEIAHAAFISQQDFERFPELNVTAEMSPAVWHIPEFGVQDGFHFNSVLKHGTAMTVGSDWVITPDPNPFPPLQGMLEHGEESVSLTTALEVATLAGARAVGRETTQGSLEAGKSANFIVLDRNLFEIPVAEIGGTKVLRTVFEGETVYSQE